jgi:hypothetical protein
MTAEFRRYLFPATCGAGLAWRLALDAALRREVSLPDHREQSS